MRREISVLDELSRPMALKTIYMLLTNKFVSSSLTNFLKLKSHASDRLFHSISSGMYHYHMHFPKLKTKFFRSPQVFFPLIFSSQYANLLGMKVKNPITRDADSLVLLEGVL